MGDYASRGSTPGRTFLPHGSLCVIYFVSRKRFRQYRGCMLGHLVPKKRFNLHQMCVLHCSIYIIPYVSPRPRPVRAKTFSTHVVVKKCHVVRKMAGFTHDTTNIVGLCSEKRCRRYGIPSADNYWTTGVEHKLLTFKQLAIFRVTEPSTLKMANTL